MKYRDYLNEQLKDDEFRKEYERLKPRYDIISELIEFRNKTEISQEKLAKMIGTDKSRISKLENGALNPTIDFLSKVAEAMGKTLHISFVSTEV